MSRAERQVYVRSAPLPAAQTSATSSLHFPFQTSAVCRDRSRTSTHSSSSSQPDQASQPRTEQKQNACPQGPPQIRLQDRRRGASVPDPGPLPAVGARQAGRLHPPEHVLAGELSYSDHPTPPPFYPMCCLSITYPVNAMITRAGHGTAPPTLTNVPFLGSLRLPVST